ncbi:MAG: PPC domain-containing protein, partial [Flavobacteriales bacterium]
AAEPNNSLFDAAYMGSFGEDNCSIIQQASVDKQSDSDFYQISINQSGSLSIDLNSIALQPDLNIRLIHNDLEVDISNNEFSSFEFIEHEVNVPGTYYIEVYAAENANFSMNECYDLTVNWQSEVITCTLNVELEDEGDCNPEDGSWDFDIEITANNVGGSTWLINGEEFPISNQIEVFTLTNFTPNGEMQNLQVQVKENPACQVFLPNFVVAPQPCLVAGNACPFDSNGDDEINATDLLAFLGAFGTQCSE